MDPGLETMEMAPEIAKKLFDEGAVLIIAGVPIGTEFGIDNRSFTVGEKFRGVKMIPPGPHYISCSSQGPYGDTAPKVGLLHYFQQREIFIREWDPEKEELRIRTKVDPEIEKSRIRENLKDLDSFLAAYDYQNLRRWRNLSDNITEELVSKLLPDTGVIRTSVEFLSCPDAERPRGTSSTPTSTITSRNIKIKSFADEEILLPNLKPVPGTAPNFTKLPDRCPKSATAAEISLHYIDSVQAVEKLLSKFQHFMDLIGEMQFAFVLFCSGGSIDALINWRKTLSLLCNSETAVVKFKQFYKKFLEMIEFQLPELPEELMEPSPKNTIYVDVKNLIVNCTMAGLKDQSDVLENGLRDSMAWTFDGILEEDPEDLPVVVEI